MAAVLQARTGTRPFANGPVGLLSAQQASVCRCVGVTKKIQGQDLKIQELGCTLSSGTSQRCHWGPVCDLLLPISDHAHAPTPQVKNTLCTSGCLADPFLA